MELELGNTQIVIKPNRRLATMLIEEVTYTKGISYLHDSIRKSLNQLSTSDLQLTFKFSGFHPYIFASHEEAKSAKDELEQLVGRTNKANDRLNIKNIDDLLFISYFYYGSVADVRSSGINAIYLDELTDVFLALMNRKLTPSSEDFIWIPDASTGIETEVPRSEFNEEDLLMNGGYKAASRMIGKNNAILHLPNDNPVVLNVRNDNENAIRLPSRLSTMINDLLIDHIIEQHKKADTSFYKELSSGEISMREWSNRTRTREYKRHNLMLYHIIDRLDKYLISNNSLVPTKKSRHVFIYDFLKILKLLAPPYKIDAEDKSSAIRTICNDNAIKSGK